MLALSHAAALALLSLTLAAPVAQRANPSAPAGGAPQGAPQARPQQPQIPQSTPGPISAEPPNIDFGVVRPGQEVNATIKLINPLDRPITITKATPSCQCTGVDIEGKQIPAKGHLEFPISIKMSSAPMKKIATLTILLEELKQVVVIKLESEIALAIRSKPPFIDVQQKLNMPTSGEVTITAADGKPFSVIAVHGKPPSFRGFDPSKDEPRVTYTLAYDLSAEIAGAKVPPYFLVETDHPECPIVDIRVRHETTQIKPRLHVNGYRSSCGRIAPGSSGEFELEIEKMGSQRITGVRSLWPDAKVELIEQIADKHGNVTIRVKVTPPADFRGMLFFLVELSAGAVTTNQLVIGSVRE